MNVSTARHAEAYDLPDIVDSPSSQQVQRRVGRDERVEIAHHTALPVERARVPARRSTWPYRRANYLSEVINPQARAHNIPGKHTERLYASLAGPQEWLIDLIAWQGRSTDHLALIIDRQCRISNRQYSGIYGPTEVAEVMHGAVTVPEHGVRSSVESRKYGVRARARDADDLAVVVDCVS